MVVIPSLQNIRKALDFTIDMENYSLHDGDEVECGNIRGCDPFPMLVVSTALRKMRKRSSAQNCRAKNANNSYAKNMRFYTASRIKTGRSLDEDYGNTRYLPITKLSVKDLSLEGINNFEMIQETIERKADQMARVLCQSNSVFKDQVSYILRELIRNIPEHSNADEVWFCAQYWPSYDLVELAILDEGIGIYGSLRNNKSFGYQIGDCETAIQWAVRPGISTAFDGSSRDFMYSDWQNTGYGLYVVKELCIGLGGNMNIASGNKCILFDQDGEYTFDCQLQGTAIGVRLKPSLISWNESLIDTIKRRGEELAKNDKNAFVFASKASGRLHRGSF